MAVPNGRLRTAGFVYLDEIKALPSRIAGRALQFEEQVRTFGFNCATFVP